MPKKDGDYTKQKQTMEKIMTMLFEYCIRCKEPKVLKDDSRTCDHCHFSNREGGSTVPDEYRDNRYN
jgi:hypothetical protein